MEYFTYIYHIFKQNVGIQIFHTMETYGFYCSMIHVKLGRIGKLPPKSQARPRSCMEDAEQDLEFLVGASREKKETELPKMQPQKGLLWLVEPS